MSQIFPGKIFSQQRLLALRERVVRWTQEHSRPPRLVSLYPLEDEASIFYTRLKTADAKKVGITYDSRPLSLHKPLRVWQRAVAEIAREVGVDGILVQKPSVAVLQRETGRSSEQAQAWWLGIAEHIPLEKDVDGLAPTSLMLLEQASERVRLGKGVVQNSLAGMHLPATAQACIEILQEMGRSVLGLPENTTQTPEITPELLTWLRQQRVVMIGRSAIVGRPVAYGLRLLGVPCELLSSTDVLSEKLHSATAIISATGKADLVSGDWIQEGAFLVDVGAPKAEFQKSAQEKSAQFTPVPGGVGPMTRVCLLENVV